MKHVKKFMALLIVFAMIMTMSTAAFAAGNSNTDENGSIKITNATVGKTYAAYKIFDATVDGNGNIAYTYDGTLPENDYFVQDKVGNISVTAEAKDENGYLTSGAIEFLGTLKGEAADASDIAESQNVVFSGLEYGYYYIETSNGSAVTVTSTNPSATVYDKNQKTAFDKKIIVGYEDDGTPVLAETNTVNVGDKVNYQIKIDATNYNGAKYITNYYVYDKMDEALTYNDDLTITVNGSELEDGDYDMVTGEAAGDYNFEINIPWVDEDGAFLYSAAQSTIVVTYSATVNEKVITTGAMKNEAEYNFNEVSTPPEGPEETIIDPDPDKPKMTTESYSTQIKICKVDGEGEALTGAKFSISGESYTVSLITEQIFEEVGTEDGTHYMLKNGSYTTDDPVMQDYENQEGQIVKANADLYDSTDKKYAVVEHITKDTNVEPIVAEGWVDENGYLTFKGLGEGDYLITELVAPNGYNLLKNPIHVAIQFDMNDKVFAAQYMEEGRIGRAEEAAVTDGTISFNVVNNAGTELPGTGGAGTTMLIICGLVLFMAAGVVLVTKKRMYNEG